MGILLGFVRPLLLESPADRTAPVAAVFESLRAALGDLAGPAADLTVELSASSSDRARCEPEVLEQLLLAFGVAALAEAGAESQLRVTAECGPSGWDFGIEDDGPEEPGLCDGSTGARRGRALLRAAAEAILESRGGELRAERRGGLTRVSLRVPAGD